MEAHPEDEFLGSRLLLVLMVVVLLAVAALAFFASLAAFDPEDRIPEVAILTPAGLAACGWAFAALGGRIARVMSGLYGAFVLAGVVWLLAQEDPAGWFSSRPAVIFTVGLVGLAVLAGVAVVVAVRGGARPARGSRPRPERRVESVAAPTGGSRLRQVLSWMVVAALIAIVAGTGWWWLRGNLLTPSCGPIADAQLRAAMAEVSGQIPGLRFTDVETDCDSVWEASVSWEHDDPQQLVSAARAAGCVVNEHATSENEAGFLVCETSGRRVVFTLDDPGSAGVGGSMSMS